MVQFDFDFSISIRQILINFVSLHGLEPNATLPEAETTIEVDWWTPLNMCFRYFPIDNPGCRNCMELNGEHLVPSGQQGLLKMAHL